MSDTSDNYAAFDFSEFTEDDFKQIDADLARDRGGPSLTIEMEQPERSEVPAIATRYENRRQSELSPLERFRPHGVLFVTDLASLAWCEVQFDYGLRQRRSKSIATRPESFISAKGKEIAVDKAVARKNDDTTKQGKAIHKALEREIRLEDLKVDITSEEELWALRLVNMLASLRCVILEGFTREMPVLGIINGQVVVGIIDEVARRPQPSKRPAGSTHSTPKSKRTRRTPSPSQPLITKFIPELSNMLCPAQDTGSGNLEQSPRILEDTMPSPKVGTSHKYTLHLMDTKTRRSNSLPSNEDTLPSRIQLMLYHRLLGELVSTSDPYNFTPLWTRLELNSSRTFSTGFLIQSGLITENDDSRTISCLDDLSKAWIEMVHKLDIPGVDSVLQIIYRLQPQASRWNRKNKGKTRAQIQPADVNLAVSQEDIDLARAIEASLKDLSPEEAQNRKPESLTVAEGLISSPVLLECKCEGVVAEGSSSKKKDSVESILDDPSTPGVTHPLPVSEPPDEEDVTVDTMTIIGTKEFTYDESLLNDHINHVLKWWRGDREPQGVSLAQSRRCFSCEYEANCEWREKKAMEISGRISDCRRPR